MTAFISSFRRNDSKLDKFHTAWSYTVSGYIEVIIK